MVIPLIRPDQTPFSCWRLKLKKKGHPLTPNVPHMHMNCALGQSSANKKMSKYAPTSTHNLGINVNRTPPTNGKRK